MLAERGWSEDWSVLDCYAIGAHKIALEGRQSSGGDGREWRVSSCSRVFRAAFDERLAVRAPRGWTSHAAGAPPRTSPALGSTTPSPPAVASPPTGSPSRS